MSFVVGAYGVLAMKRLDLETYRLSLNVERIIFVLAGVVLNMKRLGLGMKRFVWG